jgi:hypothetical protein
MSETHEPQGVELHVLGEWVVDSTPSYGLYLKLGEHLVFVDLRKDKYFEHRKRKVLELVDQEQRLADNLASFVLANPSFGARQVAYIGIHSKDMERGEVFWNPEGYTLLKGLSFVLE